MADRPEPSSEHVRKRFENQQTRDTRPEMELRQRLHARGLRYRVDRQVVPGLRRRADIVFTRARVAVFVDGCFWHRCPEHANLPKNNREWWREKLERNVQRDRDTDTRLEGAGWAVIRVWEHEIRSNPEEVADNIWAKVVGGRGRASDGPGR